MHLKTLVWTAILAIPVPAALAEEPLQDAAQRAAAALYDGIRAETLPNGLRVYLKPVREAPVVTTIVAYRVGSADEDLEHTGLAHYLEHLMFKGTDKIMPGDIDRITMRNGGQNNAYTNEDMTIYHFDFAADRWEAALKIEADRMSNLRIDARHEFNQEKGAVISELERNEDEPWDLESKEILPLLFGHGPYGHPIIGERAHVRAATADVIKGYYGRWYHPNNASLIICGGIDPEKALVKIRELFGPIPATNLPERKPVKPAIRKKAVHKEMASKFEVPRLLLGFNTVKSGDPDSYALDVVQSILTGGKTGRLYKKLVEGEEVATDVDSSDNTGRYPGWFSIQVQLLKGKDLKKAEALVLAELEKLAREPVDPVELKRAKRGLLAGAIFGLESVHALADSIARGVTRNDLDYLKTLLPRIQAVTPEEVQEVARKYLDAGKRVAIYSIPAARAGAEGVAPPAGKAGGPGRKPRAAQDAGSHDFPLQETKRVVLPNGLTLLLFENRRLPIVVAQAAVRWVHLLEPAQLAGVATLTGMLLDEGTVRHKGPEIAELIENVGGELGLNSGGGSVRILSPDRQVGLGLLFECLSEANFPADAFARQRAQLLSIIADRERQPEAVAQRLYHQLAYGKHPLGRPSLGREETVKTLSAADCRAFYRRVFVPDNTVVAIVGDFDSQQMIEEVTQLTMGWKSAPVTRPETPAVEKPAKFVDEIVPIPSAAQLHFLMGHVGIRRDNPDYYKLLVMDYVLGIGPGFTDRLSSRLRDREGLAYTVMASISNSAGEEPGLFTCYIGTQPENLAKVKKMFLEELSRIRKEKPTDQEVEDAKQYLLGSLPFEFTTNSRVARQLLMIERYKLGLDYLADYRRQVSAVTPADVEAVARKYLDPEHMVLVAVGAVDKHGKPLSKEPPK